MLAGLIGRRPGVWRQISKGKNLDRVHNFGDWDSSGGTGIKGLCQNHRLIFLDESRDIHSEEH
jgi:hypothetical protein